MIDRRISKAAFFEWIGYEIHSPDVLAMHESTGRIKIIDAPARTSKSFSTGAECAFRANPPRDSKGLPTANQLQWIIGPDFKTDKEFDYLYQWFVEEGHLNGYGSKVERAVNNPNQGNMQIVLNWGAGADGRTYRTVIEGKSATNEKALQGEEVDDAVMSEAAEHPARIYEKYLSTRCGTIFIPTTPKPHADWIKTLIERGEADPSLGVDHFHYRNVPAWVGDTIDPARSISANPKFDWDRFALEWKMAASRVETGNPEDDPRFAEQFLGLWAYYTGAVLPFRHQRSIPGRMSHLVDQLPADFYELKRFVSVDYGYDHRAAALFWAVCKDGTLLIFDEVVGTGINQADFCERIQDTLDRWGPEGESLKIDYAVGDPSRPEVGSMMRAFGFPMNDGFDKNSLRDRAAGTTRLINLLSDDPELERPKLFLYRPTTHETAEEFKKLRRKEGYVGDEFAKSAIDPNCDDDAFDAARYGVQTRPEPWATPSQRHWIYEWQSQRRQNERSMKRVARSGEFRVPSMASPHFRGLA